MGGGVTKGVSQLKKKKSKKNQKKKNSDSPYQCVLSYITTTQAWKENQNIMKNNDSTVSRGLVFN